MGRLNLPFAMLADPDFTIDGALELPTFTAGGQRLYSRLTLVVGHGRVEHVFYPIFPPDRHAQQVLAWLRANPAATCVGAFVVEAELMLGDGFDPAAVGAAVTVELCGHWEHEGACRWPHNSAIDAERDPARFRTLFVADEADAAGVRDRIETALRSATAWRVVSLSLRPVAEAERALADRLLTGPRSGR